MDIYTSLQYWFLMIFMQFAPLNELQPGTTITYQMFDTAETQLVFTIEDAVISDEQIYWIISNSYKGHSNTMLKAKLEYINDKLQITSLQENDRQMLNEGEMVPFQKPDLLLSTDTTYVLKKTATQSNYQLPIEVLDNTTLSCEKIVFSKDSLNVVIYANEMFGLLGAKIEDSDSEIYSEIRKH